jgi:hypothetical protein
LGCGGGEPIKLSGEGLDFEAESLVVSEGAQRERSRSQWLVIPAGRRATVAATSVAAGKSRMLLA